MVPEDHTGGGLKHIERYAEEKVDKMRLQKDQELEDYRKEIERAKRFEKSKLLQGMDKKKVKGPTTDDN